MKDILQYIMKFIIMVTLWMKSCLLKSYLHYPSSGYLNMVTNGPVFYIHEDMYRGYTLVHNGYTYMRTLWLQ